MAKTQLLIADDEPDLLAELNPLLERAGFAVLTVLDGEQALKAIDINHPDLIVLDVLMPHMDGREVLRQLRQQGNWTPVILLTQIGTPTERALSLQEGADDYLNKPFEPLELVARIQAVLRRSQHENLPLNSFRLICSEKLLLDRQTRRAFWDGRDLMLSARAFGVLEYLMLNNQEIITRERLLDQVWGWSSPIGTRAVDTRINEIRKSLEDDPEKPQFIETVIGSGYRYLKGVSGQK
ncbi:MAG TPA: DNA-binding response regulator [Anaerolineaceae bacterium]|nr:DNA-binding response regulator [Anaerolineaceae bacterium]